MWIRPRKWRVRIQKWEEEKEEEKEKDGNEKDLDERKKRKREIRRREGRGGWERFMKTGRRVAERKKDDGACEEVRMIVIHNWERMCSC